MNERSKPLPYAPRCHMWRIDVGTGWTHNKCCLAWNSPELKGCCPLLTASGLTFPMRIYGCGAAWVTVSSQGRGTTLRQCEHLYCSGLSYVTYVSSESMWGVWHFLVGVGVFWLMGQGNHGGKKPTCCNTSLIDLSVCQQPCELDLDLILNTDFVLHPCLLLLKRRDHKICHSGTNWLLLSHISLL